MTIVFPKYPNGFVFTAYTANIKQVNIIEFDCIRYGNLLRNNKIVKGKSQVFFRLDDAIARQNSLIERSQLLLERRKTQPIQRRLSPREREILLLFYDSKLSDKDIGTMFKITHERIRQIRLKGLRKLKITSTKRSSAPEILAIINQPSNSPNIPPPAQLTEDAKIPEVDRGAISEL